MVGLVQHPSKFNCFSRLIAAPPLYITRSQPLLSSKRNPVRTQLVYLPTADGYFSSARTKSTQKTDVSERVYGGKKIDEQRGREYSARRRVSQRKGSQRSKNVLQQKLLSSGLPRIS